MVPESIRNIPRPPNTVVVETNCIGAKRFAVRERAGYKAGPTGKKTPRNGKIIGYIHKGRYWSKDDPFFSGNAVVDNNPSFLKGWGLVRMVADVSQDICEALMKHFRFDDFATIMAIATLRILVPGIACCRLRSNFVSSLVCKFWPDAKMSSKYVSEFINKLGQNTACLEGVFVERVRQIAPDDIVIIDGCLKQDSSTVNSISQNSFKTALKGHKEISNIYAYNYNLKDLICNRTYLGDTLDANAFKDFVIKNNLTQGIIVADKGFPVSKIRDVLSEYPNLHYVSPLRRNSKAIKCYNLNSDFDIKIERSDRRVVAKKIKVNDHLYYYSYKDFGRAYKELCGSFDKNFEAFLAKFNSFGTIVFESDLDLPVETILEYCDNRWELELIFDVYKNTLDLDRTNVQSDFSVIGNEFINFIAASIQWRIAQKFNELNAKHGFLSYKDRLQLMVEAFRLEDAPIDYAERYDGTWVAPNVQNNQAFAQMEQLGLMPVTVPESTNSSTTVRAPRTRGRPKGSRNKSTIEREAKEAQAKANGTYTEPPKRRPGRPKGSLNKSTLERMAKEAQAKAEGSYTEPPKRRPGRPKGSLNKSTLERMAKEAQAKVDGFDIEPAKCYKGSLNTATQEFMNKNSEN